MNRETKAEDVLEFYSQILKLKKLVREGWKRRGVPDPESVADHTFGVCMLALVYARSFGLDVERSVVTALVHEVGESVVGDITPRDNVEPARKSQLEEQAAAGILSTVDPSGELLELWRDYEYQRTEEGRLVKELDKLEMALQAYDYEQETDLPLGEFYPYVEERLQNDSLRAVLGTLVGWRDGGNT